MPVAAKMKRILLIRWGGLGDLLVALPSIRLLRHAYPSASITLIGRRAYASLLLEARVIDHVVGEDSAQVLGLFSGAAAAGDDRKQWLARFDLIVSWLNQKTSGFLEAVRPLTAGDTRWRIICHDALAGGPMNIFFFRQTAEVVGGGEPLGRPAYDEFARLPLESLASGPRTLLPRRQAGARKFAVIHPGSGGETKRWPLENFLEIARRLKERRVDGALVTGEAEAALEREIAEEAASLGWPWLRSPALGSLAQLLSGAGLYLGNDSGITHLAACCGTEGLALFREDLLDTWRPGGRVQVLSAHSVDEIPVESVWRTAAQLLCI